MEHLNEAMELVWHTTANFFLSGLAAGEAIFASSNLVAHVCELAFVLLAWLGYARPSHHSPKRRAMLMLGGVLCCCSGVALRWMLAADAISAKIGLLFFTALALVVGFFTLLSRQGSIFRGEP